MAIHRIISLRNPCHHQDLGDADHSRRIIDYFQIVGLLLFFIFLPL